MNQELVAIAAAILGGLGLMLVQPALAQPSDPYNEFAPGLKSKTEGTSAKTFAPGQQFEHGTQPSDPYKNSPGFLNRGSCLPNQDIC